MMKLSQFITYYSKRKKKMNKKDIKNIVKRWLNEFPDDEDFAIYDYKEMCKITSKKYYEE